MKATVIIVTLNRPDCVERCLDCLAAQTRKPDQIIVVDSSKDDLTREVVTNFGHAAYIRNEDGFGRMTASRNIGLRAAEGEVIAFVDDDAFAEPKWLGALLAVYEDEGKNVAAVGGRVLPVPAGANPETAEVGVVTRNGVLHGNFWAAPPARLEISHMMGCNMSFRREVLADAGGFREIMKGISGVAEDSDMCLRLKRLGYRILFEPTAAVEHIGAPQAVGRRFDWRYSAAVGRNYTLMLFHHFGLLGVTPWRYVILQGGYEMARGMVRWRRIPQACAFLSGVVRGVLRSLAGSLGNAHDARRTDAQGDAIRKALSDRVPPTADELVVVQREVMTAHGS